MTSGFDDSYTTAVTVNLQAIVNNYHLLRERVGSQTEVAAVVKSDAYGHGMLPVSKALWNAGCRTFCVVSIDECIALKHSPCGKGRILKLTPSLPPEYEEVQRLGIEQVVSSKEDREKWEKWLSKEGKTLKVHLKADCGMGRLGYMPAEFDEEISHLAESKCFQVEGVMSHLPVSDELPLNDLENREKGILHISDEIERFSRISETTRKAFGNSLTRHIANSGAALYHPEGCFDMVRIGLALYGSDPRGGNPIALGLLPAMSFRTRLVQTRDYMPEETIGYGRTYRVNQKMRVGVIPVGYADGLFRRMGEQGYVLVRGKRCKILGRISMNLISINLSGVEEAGMGERVTLLGEDHGEWITAEEMAHWAGTISYEVFTTIGQIHAVHAQGNEPASEH